MALENLLSDSPELEMRRSSTGHFCWVSPDTFHFIEWHTHTHTSIQCTTRAARGLPTLPLEERMRARFQGAKPWCARLCQMFHPHELNLRLPFQAIWRLYMEAIWRLIYLWGRSCVHFIIIFSIDLFRFSVICSFKNEKKKVQLIYIGMCYTMTCLQLMAVEFK